MAYDFVAVGGATRDISFFTDQGILIENPRDILRQKLLAFEYGAKIRVDNFNYTFGGGAANAAVNFANFGFKAACLASIGKDENGRAVIENLRRRGVDRHLVKELPGKGSGFSFILISKTGERIIFTSRGANDFLKIGAAEKAALEKARNIYISSLSGEWLSVLKKIFSAARQNRGLVSWNPNEAQYSAGLEKLAPFLKDTYVFALNKDEAIELALTSPLSAGQKMGHAFFNDENNLLKLIKSYGPEIVLITSGADGAHAYDGLSFYYQPILKEKKRVDTTGVGDVFNSTFVAGLALYGGDIRKSLYLSARNTASKIANLGAQNGLIKL